MYRFFLHSQIPCFSLSPSFCSNSDNLWSFCVGIFSCLQCHRHPATPEYRVAVVVVYLIALWHPLVLVIKHPLITFLFAYDHSIIFIVLFLFSLSLWWHRLREGFGVSAYTMCVWLCSYPFWLEPGSFVWLCCGIVSFGNKIYVSII